MFLRLSILRSFNFLVNIYIILLALVQIIRLVLKELPKQIKRIATATVDLFLIFPRLIKLGLNRVK